MTDMQNIPDMELEPVPTDICTWEALPDELRALNQWVIARYPDKIPHRIAGGSPVPVDVTNTSLLHSFDEAYTFCKANEGWRMGFALTKSDPYVCIDIDYPKLSDENLARIGSIFEGFNSYTELSTSHRGAHIWIRGSDAPGIRNDGIEVYSSARYIITTGIPLNAEILSMDISEREMELKSLRESLSAGRPEQVLTSVADEIEEREDDNTLLNRIIPFMREGGKFSELWEGKWEGYGYPSQSEADDALMAILVRFTRNREQLKRLFLKSALGARILNPIDGKRKGKDYLDRTINSAFNTLYEPQVDMSGFVEKLENGDFDDKNGSKLTTFDNFSFPPGNLGQIAMWIYENARLPNRAIALATTFAFAAGLVGNAWSFGDGKEGCNLYVLLVGPSGIGKNGSSTAINDIVRFCSGSDGKGGISDFYVFSNFVSAPALARMFVEQKQFLNIRKEISDLLVSLSNGKGNPRYEELSSYIKDLYHESGVNSIASGRRYASKENDIEAKRGVCFSLFGETTHEGLYSNLSSKVSEDGLTSRFSIFITNGERPEYNEKRTEFPQHLIQLLVHMGNIVVQRSASTTTLTVPLSNDAKRLFKDCETACRMKINACDANNHLERSQYSRLTVKALKYATLIAVFNNPNAPVVMPEEMEYAIKLAQAGCDSVLDADAAGLVGEGEDARVDAFMDKILSFFKGRAKKGWSASWKKMREQRCVPYRYIYDNVRKISCFRNFSLGASRGMEDAAKILCGSGKIMELNPLDVQKEFGVKARVFRVLEL